MLNPAGAMLRQKAQARNESPKRELTARSPDGRAAQGHKGTMLEGMAAGRKSPPHEANARNSQRWRHVRKLSTEGGDEPGEGGSLKRFQRFREYQHSRSESFASEGLLAERDSETEGWHDWLCGPPTQKKEDVSTSSGRFHCPIHPLSMFYQTWEFVSGLLLLYTTAVTPLLIGFYSELEGYCGHSPTIRMDLVVDLFFLIEIGIHFLTGKMVRGVYINTFREVARIYLGEGLVVDACSACPIAWMEFFLSPDITCAEAELQGGSSDFIRYLRLIRMLRMLRLLKVLKIFNVLRTFFRMRPTVIQILKCGFSVFMISHLGGCIWWFVKLRSTPDMEVFKAELYVEETVASKYVAAVYFQMATLCTVGYGDFHADYDQERLLMTFIMLLGASIFAMIISNMSALFDSFQSRESKLFEEMDLIVDFLRANKLPRRLEDLVEGFFQFKIRQQISLQEKEHVLEELPAYLYEQVELAVHTPFLSKVPLLQPATAPCIMALNSVLEKEFRCPGERIYSHGDESDALYIVASGTVHLLVPRPQQHHSGHVLQAYHDGDLFGFTSIVLGTGRVGDARAVGFVELYRVWVEDWLGLQEEFPALGTIIRYEAHKEMEMLAGVMVKQDNQILLNDFARTSRQRWIYLTHRMVLRSIALSSQGGPRDNGDNQGWNFADLALATLSRKTDNLSRAEDMDEDKALSSEDEQGQGPGSFRSTTFKQSFSIPVSPALFSSVGPSRGPASPLYAIGPLQIDSPPHLETNRYSNSSEYDSQGSRPGLLDSIDFRNGLTTSVAPAELSSSQALNSSQARQGVDLISGQLENTLKAMTKDVNQSARAARRAHGMRMVSKLPSVDDKFSRGQSGSGFDRLASAMPSPEVQDARLSVEHDRGNNAALVHKKLLQAMEDCKAVGRAQSQCQQMLRLVNELKGELNREAAEQVIAAKHGSQISLVAPLREAGLTRSSKQLNQPEAIPENPSSPNSRSMENLLGEVTRGLTINTEAGPSSEGADVVQAPGSSETAASQGTKNPNGHGVGSIPSNPSAGGSGTPTEVLGFDEISTLVSMTPQNNALRGRRKDVSGSLFVSVPIPTSSVQLNQSQHLSDPGSAVSSSQEVPSSAESRGSRLSENLGGYPGGYTSASLLSAVDSALLAEANRLTLGSEGREALVLGGRPPNGNFGTITPMGLRGDGLRSPTAASQENGQGSRRSGLNGSSTVAHREQDVQNRGLLI